MALPNLGAHANAVDMGTTLQREIRSNSRDWLLDNSENQSINLDVTAGGTIALTTNQHLENGLIRLTGSPGAGFTIDIPDGNRRLEFENVSGQTATIDTVSGATPTVSIPTGETRIIHVVGVEFSISGLVGLEAGALLHSGQVDPTAIINFADFELARAKLKDYGFTTTTPSSSSGTLTLDMENGNYFDVTLTENVTTLNLNNPPASGVAGTLVFIATQDAGGTNVITWPASVIWEQDTGESPAQTTTTLAVDIYMLLTVDAGTTWYGFVLGLNMG